MAKAKKEKKKIGQNVNPNSSFFGLSLAKLKHMDVEGKFTFTFMRLLIIIAVAAVAMFFIIGLEFFGMRTMHATYLKSVEQAGEARYHSLMVQAEVLWALADEHPGDKETHTTIAAESMALADADVEVLAKTYKDKEDITKLQELSEGVHEHGVPLVGMITGGENTDEEIYEYFESNFEPAMSAYLEQVELISSKSVTDAEDMWKLARNVTIVLIIVSVIIAAIAISFLIRAAIVLTASIREPVLMISGAADEMAKGNLNVDIE